MRRAGLPGWISLLGRALVCIGWVAGCTGAPAPPPLPEAGARAERVVLVSVSGLSERAFDVMPTLRALGEAGVLARRVEPAAPASERPAHATLITGARPAIHGIVADRRLGERGVRPAGYDHVTLLSAPTLWQRAAESGLRVASLDWPSTLGAAIELLAPAVDDATESWSARLEGEATPELRAILDRHGATEAGTGARGPARDAVIRAAACELLGGPSAPALLLLRLGQASPRLLREGPGSQAAREAFGRVDTELAALLACLRRAGRLTSTALAVSGDHGVAEVHTAIAPNGVLLREGLVLGDDRGVRSWRALSRSNGGSAFVYARDEDAAVSARVALGAAATRSGAFRVVPADEMIRAGCDPEAWFGLEAEPGFVFVDRVSDALLAPSSLRGAGGYLPGWEEMEPAFVAWGGGVRASLRVPELRQTDVAPTLARLLGIRLEARGGRALVGLLTPEAVAR